MAITYAQNVGLVKTPPRIEINGKFYRTVKIGSLIWTADVLDDDNITHGTDSRGLKTYTSYNISSAISNNTLVLPAGWRMPSNNDIGALFSYSPLVGLLATGDSWNNLGTNTSTMSITPSENVSGHSGKYFIGLRDSSSTGYKEINLSGTTLYVENKAGDSRSWSLTARFCRNAD